ncbi:MAG: transcriptional regulator [Rhodobacterales bacterium 65-51]|uniref:Lrp/AsnC family transcriptional regulator n=1 Tax=uncultured Gemmobacter sp. TaxID=1095917 RepID=UPI000960426D|nr:Lrp/AsnC family transcriptional regulator [uncultured Gemmobacter sp.]OJY36196.1 MAG: transcriptional regulator [Rhodobacterales bacterium 65-51]
MDRIDRQILTELQRDASQSLARLAHQVGLSQTACWKRVQKLEAAGIITGRVALVDPARVGLGLTVFVEIAAIEHSDEWRAEFLAALDPRPEVMEVHRLGGSMDYMLRVVVPDMAAFDRFYQELTQTVRLRAIISRFVMETLRRRDVLPIPEA